MISVIIPYKDSEPWIGRCAESLKNQAGDFEFVFVNDFSSDNGEKVLRKMADERFVLVDNWHGHGVSGARNTGIEVALGDWITFLDADDEMLPNAYRKFVKTIEQDPDAVVHQLNHRRYYADTGIECIKFANNEGRFEIPEPPLAWFGVWNKLYKAEFIQDVRFDEQLQYGEDGMFNLECFAKGAYVHCGDRMVTAVRHRFDNDKSLSHIKTGPDILKQIHSYLAFLERQTDPKLRLFMCFELMRLFSTKRLQILISGCNYDGEGIR